MDEQEERIRLYERRREELGKRQMINSQIYDTSVLSFSMGTLAVLSNFLKGLHLNCSDRIMMFFATISLVLAVFSTLLSFIVSNEALKKELDIAKEYYLNKDEKAANAENPYRRWLTVFNYLSGAMFILGLSLALFVI